MPTWEETFKSLDPSGALQADIDSQHRPVMTDQYTYTRPLDGDVAERAKKYIKKMPPAIQGQNGSAATYAVATALVHGFDLSPGVALSILAHEYNPRCEPAWSDAELRHKIDEAASKAHRQPKGWLLQDRDDGGGLNFPAPAASASRPPSPSSVGQEATIVPGGPGEIDDPYSLAHGFLALTDFAHLRDYEGQFIRWAAGAYSMLSDSQVVNPLSNWIEGAFKVAHALAARKHAAAGDDGKEPPKKKQVTRTLVNNTLGAIRGLTHVGGCEEVPAWIGGRRDRPDPRGLIALRNGLYDIAADKLGDLSPQFLTFSAAPFDYDPDAPKPSTFLKFLADVWPSDPDSIACLQEWFGYLLTPDNTEQKILFLLGPPRAGKGTIARILEALVGPQNVAAPMLSTLAMDYAVAGLVGKSVALIGDARLSGRVDSAHVAGVLNTISGNDKITIPRKYKDDLQVRLNTRFVILSNEMPRIQDSSGAFSKRLVMLQFSETFLGREDKTLDRRIIENELPGILLWAVEGLRRLKKQNGFTQPQSAAESLAEMEDLGSPVGLFLRERCVIQSGASVVGQELYDAWKAWCEESGRREPGTRELFGRDVKAVDPTIKKKRVKQGGELFWAFCGVRFKEEGEEQKVTNTGSGFRAVPGDLLLSSQGNQNDSGDRGLEIQREIYPEPPGTRNPDASEQGVIQW